MRSEHVTQSSGGVVQTSSIPKLSNNGYATPFFELQRGVRQGCPLSGILFVIAVEIFANSIRDDHSIMGINIKGKE